jgi:hypothetical protein
MKKRRKNVPEKPADLSRLSEILLQPASHGTRACTSIVQTLSSAFPAHGLNDRDLKCSLDADDATNRSMSVAGEVHDTGYEDVLGTVPRPRIKEIGRARGYVTEVISCSGRTQLIVSTYPSIGIDQVNQ